MHWLILSKSCEVLRCWQVRGLEFNLLGHMLQLFEEAFERVVLLCHVDYDAYDGWDDCMTH